jgi:hypothetical protein
VKVPLRVAPPLRVVDERVIAPESVAVVKVPPVIAGDVTVDPARVLPDSVPPESVAPVKVATPVITGAEIVGVAMVFALKVPPLNVAPVKVFTPVIVAAEIVGVAMVLPDKVPPEMVAPVRVNEFMNTPPESVLFVRVFVFVVVKMSPAPMEASLLISEAVDVTAVPASLKYPPDSTSKADPVGNDSLRFAASHVQMMFPETSR